MCEALTQPRLAQDQVQEAGKGLGCRAFASGTAAQLSWLKPSNRLKSVNAACATQKGSLALSHGAL